MSSQGKEPRCWALSRHFNLEEFNLKDVFLQGPEVLSKDLLKISAPPSNFLPDPHLRRQQRLEHHQHWGIICLLGLAPCDTGTPKMPGIAPVCFREGCGSHRALQAFQSQPCHSRGRRLGGRWQLATKMFPIFTRCSELNLGTCPDTELHS